MKKRNENKRFARILSTICALLLVFQAFGAIGALPLGSSAEEPEENVVEVATLAEFRRAFNTDELSYTVRLTEDISFDDLALYGSYTNTYDSCITIKVSGDVTVDFAGHTITYEQVYESDLYDTFHRQTKIDYAKNPRTYSYALKFVLYPQSATAGSTLRFADSVGGGGVTMRSKLKSDVQLAAVYIANSGGYIGGTTTARLNKVIVDGGRFDLYSETKEHGKGTRDANNHFRGAFITDYMNVTINGGVFTARGDGSYSRRELAAFGTATVYARQQREGETSGFCTINAGIFESDAYAIHHFDPGQKDDDGVGILNTTRCMEYPKIVNGVFKGRVGYLGMTYADSDGASSLIAKPAYEKLSIPLTTCAVYGKYKSGFDVNNPANMKLRDMHGIKELCILDVTAFSFACSVPHPVDGTYYRIDDDVDTYTISYTLPAWIDGVTAKPFIKIIYNGNSTKYDDTAELTVAYGDYTALGEVTVRTGLEIKAPGYVAKEIGVNYDFEVTVVDEPVYIYDQPTDCAVDTGEFAYAHVSAINVQKYQWQLKYNGQWLNLTPALTSGLTGLQFEGLNAATLRFKSDKAQRQQFRCRLTGTDGVTVSSSTVWLKCGDAPQVYAFVGGGYTADHDARFILSGKYFRDVTYTVDRGSAYGTERFVSLEEFKTLTGIDYGVNTHDNYSILTLKNVPASVSGKYKVGYAITNAISDVVQGSAVTLDLEKMLSLKLDEPTPNVTKQIEDAACFEGETCVFFFEGYNMTGAEWSFEKYDEDEGVTVAYTLDAMRARFPETTFTAAYAAGSAALTVENAAADLDTYTVCARALGNAASVSAGSASLVFLTDVTTPNEDLNGDGLVNISDVTALLNALAGEETPPAAYDLDDNGTVNISDVTTLLNVLASN